MAQIWRAIVEFFRRLFGHSPTPSEPPPAKVTVEVCEPTGYLPNDHCRKRGLVTTIEVDQGEEPKEICDVHAKPIGPPFVGLSCYQAIDFSVEQNEKFLKASDLAGSHLAEFFVCRGWQPMFEFQGARYCPQIYKLVGTWQDHGFTWPMWDLTQYDSETVEKWKSIAQLCRKYSIWPILRIHDFCSLEARFYDPWRSRRYPWYANKQNHEIGGGMVTGGLWDDKIGDWDKYHLGWLDRLGQKTIFWWYYRDLEKWLEIFEGTDPFIMPMNEADYKGGQFKGESDEDYDWRASQRVYSFHAFYADACERLGVPKEKIIASTTRAQDLIRPRVGWLEIHGCNSPEQLAVIRDKFGTKGIFPNGDGPDKYAKGLAGSIGYVTHEPSVEQASQMRLRMIEDGFKMYCTFSRPIERGEPADIDGAQESMPMLAALAGYK